MSGFWIFMAIMALLAPGIMIGFGAYSYRHAPDQINAVFGYRTTRSMKNKDTWDFAHHECGRLWKQLGWLLAPLSLAAMLFSLGKSTEYIGYFGIAVMGVQLVVMIGSIFSVESALKRTFDQNGQRRR
ncbi:MAG: SdpI family protein [Oscillospiraceae bacterium]|nr:SdpI family protein [Oscillospiraceae bacterium]